MQATGTRAIPPSGKPSMAPIGPPRTSQSSSRIIRPTPTIEPNARAKYSRPRMTRRRPGAVVAVGIIELACLTRQQPLDFVQSVDRFEGTGHGAQLGNIVKGSHL